MTKTKKRKDNTDSKKTGGTKEDQEIQDDFLYQIIKIWES
jgi:hypothetical protein